MDAESRKRTLQSLLNTGRSGTREHIIEQPSSVVRDVARAVRQAPEPCREGGGFFRDTLQAPAERDPLGDIPTSGPAQPEPDVDEDDALVDELLMEYSETLLAIKVLTDAFPARGAPRNCPRLVLHSQLQDYLHGRQNLELDQELQRLQDSSEIVLLKFSSSSSDSVVLLQSEFQKALERLKDTPAGSESQQNCKGHANDNGLRCEAVDRLGALVASGVFRVQLHEAKLARALSTPAGASSDTGGAGNSNGHARDAAAADGARRADVLSRRRRGGLRVAGSASGARSASPDGDAAGGGGGAGGEASGEALMAELLRAGLLLRHTTGTVSIMRLCVPGVGNVMAAVERARKEVQLSLRRRRNREATEKALMDKPLKSSRLGWEFHLRDLAGKGLVQRVTHGNNTVVRLVQQ